MLIVRLLVSLLVNMAALALANWLFDGVTIDGFWNLLLAAVIFGVINFLLKPVLVLFSIPLILLTLGLFLLLINIALLALTDWIAGDGFNINGFWTYVGTVIVIWIVNTVLGMFTKRIED